MQAILIASDPDERDILAFVLKHVGLAITIEIGLRQAAEKWLKKSSDLVVFAGPWSSSLSDEIAALRTVTHVPVLLLLDNLTEEQLRRLLRAGADLVLMRPVSPLVFSEYVLTLLRRTEMVPAFSLPQLNLTGIRLDPDTRTVFVSGEEPKRLTQLEFRLLYILMVNRGQVVPTDVIVERVWGYSGQGGPELLRGLVSRLRRKVQPHKDSTRFIQNVPGVGYRFTIDDS